jgi:capsular polysaccharide transport system permease protein
MTDKSNVSTLRASPAQRVSPAPVRRDPVPIPRPTLPGEPSPPAQKAPPRKKKRLGVLLRRFVLSKLRLHLIVTLPTLVVAIYYVFIASDLYSAESKFIIRGRQQLSMSSPLTQMLNMTGLTRAYDETFTVSDFVVSRDAMEAMNKELDLRVAFNRPEVDFLSTLWWGDSNEDLLTYYRDKVKVLFDSTSNISTLTTFAFTPDEARKMNEILLRLSETIVNRLNERAQRDSVELAQQEVDLAEERVRQARIEMTKFRKEEGTLDPAKGSLIIIEIIARLEAELATTRAQISEVEALSQKDNPRLLGLNNRVQALQSQIEKERARLTGSSNDAYADQIERYEGLLIDTEFSNKRLIAAIQSLEVARVEALRQNLYLVRIVEPVAADDALYPKRILNTVTVFAILLLIYWLSTLIWAAAREHKN